MLFTPWPAKLASGIEWKAPRRRLLFRQHRRLPILSTIDLTVGIWTVSAFYAGFFVGTGLFLLLASTNAEKDPDYCNQQ